MATLRQQSRKWSLVTYLPRETLLARLSSLSGKVIAYAFILHDKDVTSDGSPKEPHIHLLLRTAYPLNLSTVRRWFAALDDDGKPITTTAQVCNDLDGAFQYLTHANDPQKFQYDPDDIVCTDISAFCLDDGAPSDDMAAALADLLAGVPLRDVAARYGRDFIIHYASIRLLVQDIMVC